MNADDWRSALYNAGASYAVYRVASQLADVADPSMEASISAENIGKRVGIGYGLNGGETRVRALLRDAEIHGWHEVVAHGRGAPNRYRLTIGRRWAMAGENGCGVNEAASLDMCPRHNPCPQSPTSLGTPYVDVMGVLKAMRETADQQIGVEH